MKINTPVDLAKTDQDAPETARESIRAAMDEVKEKIVEENKETKTQDEKTEKVEKIEPEKKVEPPVEPAKKEDKEPPAVEADKKEEKDEPKEPKAKSSKPAPFGLPKSVRAKWEDTDPEVQDYLAKTVKENLDTKANQGRKSYLNDVDQVLTPYLPELQKLGASPAQLVHRLLQYSDALSSEQMKYQAIAKLAQDFKIDLSLFGKKQTSQGQTDETITDDNYLEAIPPELNTKLDLILNKFSQLETTHKSENDKAAERTVNEWSGFDPTTKEYKTKPYFPYVRQTMANLIASNTIPLVDGKIDLDSIYDAACYAHPEIREYMMEEQAKAIQAKKLEEQKQQAAALTRTKNAGTSIRPAAPAPRLPSQTNQKTNGDGRQLSVRDSLRAAIAEAREQRI